jgi:hypothetical protein
MCSQKINDENYGSNHLVVSARQYISDYHLVLGHYITHLMATRWRRLVLYGI